MLRLTLRNLVARKVRLVMSTLAIVLGVGFLSGVMTFSHGLGATFDNIIQGSTSDALVRPEGSLSFSESGAGTSSTITPETVDRLAGLPEVARADGSVDGTGAFLLDEDGKLVGGQGAPTLVFNDSGAPNMVGEPSLLLQDGAWPSGEGEVVLDTAAAEQGGYEIGDDVGLIIPTARSFEESTRQLTLVGTAEFNGGGTAGAVIAVLETAQAQELFLDGEDVFTTVALTAAPGVSQSELADAAEAVLPAGFTAVTGDKVVKESQDQVGQFLDVITIFLTVFALIAILVGGFIIFNTFSILVTQRVRESALLRALGASRRQVTRSVLVEAFVMALVGATAGLLLGLGLSRALALLFRSFGLDISSEVLVLTPGTVVWAYVVGVVVTMAAAWFPARRAAKVAPVAALRDDLVVQEKSLRLRSLVGGVAMLIGVALAAAGLVGAPGNDAIWIGAASVIWVITTAVLAPVVGRPVLVACRALFGRVFGTTGRLAAENAMRSPRRTGATASALMIGLAVVSAVGVLAASLSATSDAIVDDQFTSDFLVQSPSFTGFPTAIGDEMARTDGVATVARQQGTTVKIDDEVDYVIGVDEAFGEVYPLDMVEGTDRITGDQAIISTSRAEDGLEVGSTVPLEFPGGTTTRVEVVGIFEDTPVTAQITVPMSVLTDAGQKRNDASLSVNVEEDADLAAVKDDLDAIVADLPIVSVQDKVEFAEQVQGQINQLLYMIYGLLALAVVIAIFGIVNTLGLSVLERTREIGLLRAVGLSRARLRRMITLESVSISLLGAVLGMAVGLLIGVLLREALKEDISTLALPITSLVFFLVVAVVIGVLAAVVPAIRASRLKVLDAIATE